MHAHQKWGLRATGLLLSCIFMTPAFAALSPKEEANLARMKKAWKQAWKEASNNPANKVRLTSPQDRTSGLQTAPDTCYQLTPFIFGSNRHQREVDHITAYNQDTGGIGLSGEVKLQEGFSLGGGAAYANGDFVTNPAIIRVKSDTTQIFGYGNYTNENLYSTLSLSLAETHNRSRRNVSTHMSAHGKYRTLGTVGKLIVGYMFNFPAVILSPEALFQYAHFNQRAYTETGGGAANLSVARNQSDTTRGGLGLRFIKTNFLPIVPEAHAFYLRDFHGPSQANSTQISTGVILPKSTTNNAKDTWNLGLSMKGYLSPNLYLLLAYDFYAKKKKYRENSGSLNLRWAF